MRERRLNGKARMGSSQRMLILGLVVLLLSSVMAACSSNFESSQTASDANSGDGGGNVSYSDQMGISTQVTSGSDDSAAAAVLADEAGVENDTQAPGMEQIAADDSGLNRKLIYKADVNMEVRSYTDAQSSIRELAHLSGGYILNFEENQSTHERSGTYTLKVPSQGFSSLLEDLERMEPISIHRSVQGTDVTSEYVDLEARMKAKRVVESRLLSFMEDADSSQDLLAFSNELATVQEEIERVLGRLRYLDQNIAFSTITIRVYERLDGKALMMGEDDPLYERAYLAMGKSLRLLRDTLEGLVVGISALLPIVLVLGLIAVPVTVVYRRNRKTGRGGGAGGASSGSTHHDTSSETVDASSVESQGARKQQTDAASLPPAGKQQTDAEGPAPAGKQSIDATGEAPASEGRSLDSTVRDSDSSNDESK